MPSERPLRDGDETGFHLIETMRREPGKGIARRGLHLKRLENSAHALGFAFDRQAVDDALAALPATGAAQRVRLTLKRDGKCAAQAFDFTPLARDTVWRVRIAAATLDSADPLLRHKTSRRAIHEAARAEFSQAEADEVLLLNERGEVCEGTITSIFLDAGGQALLTPPLACGLLDGVLRAEMIARGEARETVVTPDALSAARRLFVGNSLRGLIPARLVAR